MANVIDRLRVQGNPAPRNLPSQPDSALRKLAGRDREDRGEVPPGPHPLQFVVNHSPLHNRDGNSGRRTMNQAARRLEHLHRVQHANQGLTTMDLRQPDLPGKQFMLRGKPASADTLLHRQQQQQEWTSNSVPSSKSAHAGLARSQPKPMGDAVTGVLSPTCSELREGAVVNGPTSATTNTAAAISFLPSSLRPPYPASATSYFLLASANTLHHPNSRSAQAGSRNRGVEATRQGFSGGESAGVIGGRRQANSRHSAGSAASFELTGHQVMTPRRNAGNEDVQTYRDLNTRSPRYRSGFKDAQYFTFRDRRSPGLKDATTEPPSVDPQSLRQCLHVQQSTHPDSTTEVHKHLSQFTRTEAKVNYNNPYRQTRTKERRALPESERRYIFDSVASYIHFNKIYPNLKDSAQAGNSIKSTPQRSGLPGLSVTEGIQRVPHLAGFPKHCTDTILLRMMFEMNRPGAIHGIGLGHQAAGAPSMKSSASTKYFDIARHRDLDEFTVQGDTPSLTTQRQPPPPPLSQQQISNRKKGKPTPPPSPISKEGEEEKRKNEEEKAPGQVLGDEEEEGEEDEATLITATTPGRRLVGDDDADDADDEDSQWNAQGADGKGRGGGDGKGRGGGAVKREGGIGEEGYDSSDSSVDINC